MTAAGWPSAKLSPGKRVARPAIRDLDLTRRPPGEQGGRGQVWTVRSIMGYRCHVALTEKGRATRERILVGAAEYVRGDIPGEVTLDDIRAITGTSKSQISTISRRARRNCCSRSRGTNLSASWTTSSLTSEASPPGPRGIRWRDAVVARYRAQGRNCPLGALMAQAGQHAGRGRGRHCSPGAVAGAPHPGHHPDAGRGPRPPGAWTPTGFSAAFIAGIQGGVQVLRSTGSTRHLEATLDALIDHLRGV